MTAPAMGASQNSQSWVSAAPPVNRAGPVERAGFTEVLVTGMVTRWIRARQRPMPSGAKPAGARRSVTPRMTHRNTAVNTTSTTRPASSE